MRRRIDQAIGGHYAKSAYTAQPVVGLWRRLPADVEEVHSGARTQDVSRRRLPHVATDVHATGVARTNVPYGSCGQRIEPLACRPGPNQAVNDEGFGRTSERGVSRPGIAQQGAGLGVQRKKPPVADDDDESVLHDDHCSSVDLPNVSGFLRNRGLPQLLSGR